MYKKTFNTAYMTFEDLAWIGGTIKNGGTDVCNKLVDDFIGGKCSQYAVTIDGILVKI